LFSTLDKSKVTTLKIMIQAHVKFIVS